MYARKVRRPPVSITQGTGKPKTHNRNRTLFNREVDEYQPCTTRKMTDDEVKQYDHKGTKSKEACDDQR